MRSFSSVFAIATVVAVEKRGVLLSSCCCGSAAWKQTASCVLGSSAVGSLCEHKSWTPGKTTECLLKFVPPASCGNVDWVLYLMRDGIPTGVLTTETYVGCVGKGMMHRWRPRTVTLLSTHCPRLGRMALILYMAPHGSVIIRTKARSHRPGPVWVFVWN